MIGRAFLILLAGSWVGGASAQSSSCAPLYREVYVEFAKTGKMSKPDDVMIYLVHFDHSAGLSDAYDEAEGLFNALDAPEEKHTEILNELSKKMLNGELCPGAIRLSLEQTVELLKPTLKN